MVSRARAWKIRRRGWDIIRRQPKLLHSSQRGDRPPALRGLDGGAERCASTLGALAMSPLTN